ncbi:iron uptake transporter deferrochelatase/peroxidase subunit [Raineyella sp. W15-4]|uniref:iron uptake transporter deferrochelatase/peroxidase subunit n=1 Tax=Raineyella sp. W15-4 TaxID=3081651 RepID=UPI0029539E69|nr:iron uptake transporter deferrochelatase/peroxidase subunit [Raineyella sp. W15-4]WOQ16391.1 iron uptake transporter deferrochelatase/peroxidase subunit [Raineyella sp. W15-4]
MTTEGVDGPQEPRTPPDRTPEMPEGTPVAPSGAAPGVSRRGMIAGALWGGLGGAILGGAGGGAAGWALATRDRPDTIDLGSSQPFYGQPHQGGIATAPQRYSMFTAFSMAESATTRDLQVLLARWSAAIAVLQRGDPVGTVQPDSPVQPPKDTGEAYGLSPANLTVTVGLGPGLFGDRYGLARFKPAEFAALPALNGDTLDPRLTGGDLSVQACADDPQVCYHAVRNLARIGRSTVTPSWTVLGFGRASAGPGQDTPRNLMGFKDGTRNVSTPEQYDQWVWIRGADQPWMEGGSYQVVRKIRMLLETWDTDRIGDQQSVFGRDKREGAPLSGQHEFDTPDFAASGTNGDPLIPATSHIALAAHENNDGTLILRRPYNYTDGLDAEGRLDAGLLFICYVNHPEHFVRLQNRLGASDRLNEYIRHIGSAVFAVPPAPAEGHYLAETLFG